MTPIFMHVEKWIEIDNEFSVKPIDYSTRFDFNVKTGSSLLYFIKGIKKITRAPIKLVSLLL